MRMEGEITKDDTKVSGFVKRDDGCEGLLQDLDRLAGGRRVVDRF